MSLARRISWWSLVAMVVLVPLVMSDFSFPGLEGRLAFSSVMMVKLSALRVLALVSLGAWSWDLLRRGGRIRRTGIDWLILAWLAWGTVTTATSIHWPTALLGAIGRYEGLLTFATYALIYFLTLQFGHEPSRVHRLAQALFFTSLVVAVYGLMQYAGLIAVPSDVFWDEKNRAFGTFGNPMILGGFLVFTVSVALGLALRERRLLLRLIYWLGFGLNGLALIVSFTRGAWVGGFAAVVLLLLMAWRQRTAPHRVDLLPAGLCVLAAVGVIWRSLSATGDVMNFGKRITSIFDFGSGSGQTRMEIWQAAATAIKRRPLFGWGPDTFGFVFRKFQPVEYVRDGGSNTFADNAHDYPLQLASGLGIIGSLLFFGIFVWAGLKSFRTVFGRSGDDNRILLGAFWAAAAGYLLHLLFAISVPGVTFLLWMALALLLAPSAKVVEVRRRRWGTIAAVAVVVLAVAAIGGQGVVMAADTQYAVAAEDFSQHSTDERLAAATRAVELNGLSPEHHRAVGGVYAEQVGTAAAEVARGEERGNDVTREVVAFETTFADARSALEDAIAFAPCDYVNYVNLASVYNAAGQVLGEDYYRQAIQVAEQGLELDPFGNLIRVRLAEALRATGKVAEAAQALEYCVQIDPKDGISALALADIYEQQGKGNEALSLLESVDSAAPGQDGVATAIKALETGRPLPD